MAEIYIQITDRCNMECPHCCFSCSSQGSDMSSYDFTKALQLATSIDETPTVTIGGGEPTLHKLCMDFIWQAMRSCFPASYDMGTPAVGLVTNGSVRKSALAIAKLAEEGLISARLSYDTFHDTSMVDESVLRAFKHGDNDRRKERDSRAVNPYSYRVTPHGRALENDMGNHPFKGEDSCCCEGLFIKPDGSIYQCGCREHKVGHVNDLEAFLAKYHAFMARDEDADMLPCSKKIKMP